MIGDGKYNEAHLPRDSQQRVRAIVVRDCRKAAEAFLSGFIERLGRVGGPGTMDRARLLTNEATLLQETLIEAYNAGYAHGSNQRGGA
jgi:hypothetical protein